MPGREEFARVVSGENGFQVQAGDFNGPVFMNREIAENQAIRLNAHFRSRLQEFREECCKAVCRSCQDGPPIFADDVWVHKSGTQMYKVCAAESIRRLGGPL